MDYMVSKEDYFLEITAAMIEEGRQGKNDFETMMDMAEITLDCGELKPGLYRRQYVDLGNGTDFNMVWSRV